MEKIVKNIYQLVENQLESLNDLKKFDSNYPSEREKIILTDKIDLTNILTKYVSIENVAKNIKIIIKILRKHDIHTLDSLSSISSGELELFSANLNSIDIYYDELMTLSRKEFNKDMYKVQSELDLKSHNAKQILKKYAKSYNVTIYLIEFLSKDGGYYLEESLKDVVEELREDLLCPEDFIPNKFANNLFNSESQEVDLKEFLGIDNITEKDLELASKAHQVNLIVINLSNYNNFIYKMPSRDIKILNAEAIKNYTLVYHEKSSIFLEKEIMYFGNFQRSIVLKILGSKSFVMGWGSEGPKKAASLIRLNNKVDTYNSIFEKLVFENINKKYREVSDLIIPLSAFKLRNKDKSIDEVIENLEVTVKKLFDMEIYDYLSIYDHLRPDMEKDGLKEWMKGQEPRRNIFLRIRELLNY
jgi:hypothetical protein